MIQIASIVEGHGEVHALPALLRRMQGWRPGWRGTNALRPIRVHRDRFLNREDELRKQLLLAAAKCGEEGWVLVLLDADDDCPATLAADVYRRAATHLPHRRLSVVIANREFEAWFIAAARSLDGRRGFRCPDGAITSAETSRDAKGWIGRNMESGNYSEVIHQPAFAAAFDLQQAFDNSRSFRKLCKEWDINVVTATPGGSCDA